jgi:hypothetical protein
MNWVKTYEAYIFEAAPASKEVVELEKLLKLPANSGIFKTVTVDKAKRTLIIEQPTDLSSMDSGAVIAAINKEKPAVKRAYSGVQFIEIGGLQIKL